MCQNYDIADGKCISFRAAPVEQLNKDLNNFWILSNANFNFADLCEREIRKAYETKKTHLRHTVPFSIFYGFSF